MEVEWSDTNSTLMFVHLRAELLYTCIVCGRQGSETGGMIMRDALQLTAEQAHNSTEHKVACFLLSLPCPVICIR